MEQMKRNLEHFWLFHKKAVVVFRSAIRYCNSIIIMKTIINWIKKFWEKQEKAIEDCMPIAFPEPEEINKDNLCPTCHKDFGCQCE